MEDKYLIRGRIGLVDADLLDGGTRHPNLAVMKLSGYFKRHGCDVVLIEDYSEIDCSVDVVSNFDALFVSKVFDFTTVAADILAMRNVYIGGTGFFFDNAEPLPDEIEHGMPDYHVYDAYIEHDTRHVNQPSYWKDYKDYSIGFATRGCFRQCAFCVNHNKKKVEFHSHVSEWLDPSRKYIYLWDDNIFGYAGWRDVFDELKKIGKPFQFRQGMDIRILTTEKAQVLAGSKYRGDIIFAFDHMEDAPVIEEKLRLWRKHCQKPTKLYVLSGFASQDEKEIESVFERIAIIMKYGAFPYIMRHEKYLTSTYRGMFVAIARWCNQPSMMRNYSFREYCECDQRMRKTSGLCSSMRALTEFEAKFPDIAERYFDMKYNEQQYVVERKRGNNIYE